MHAGAAKISTHTITVQFAVSSDSFDDATECVDIKQNTLPAWPITFIKI